MIIYNLLPGFDNVPQSLAWIRNASK